MFMLMSVTHNISVSTAICQMPIYPLSLLLRIFMSLTRRIIIVYVFFLYCILMSQVTVSISNALLIVVCFRATTMTVTLVPTAVDLLAWGQHNMHTTEGLTALGQHDVALLPQLILRDTVRGSLGIATVLQQQQPQSWMPSQAYASLSLVFFRWVFSFRLEPPTNLLY